MGGVGDAAGVVGIGPEKLARGTAVPEGPVHVVGLGIFEEIGVGVAGGGVGFGGGGGVAGVGLVFAVDVGGVIGKAQLLHPDLGVELDVQAHGLGVGDDGFGEVFES